MSDNHLSEMNNIILNSITDGVFTVDRDWRITSFNNAAEQITGISRAWAIGRYCWEVFKANICQTNCSLRQTLETGNPVINKAVTIVNASGKKIPISICTGILRDESQKVIGGVETFRDLSLVEELRKELKGRHTFSDIISKNHEMQNIFQILPDIAESDSTVLIEGPTGSGKELLARAIHNLSLRKNNTMVAVNCAALPDTLLESELFGYMAGAFTDARRNKQGRFARAEGGTILLDEIGDISPALQVKLLRVLQEKEYEPLGATSPVKCNVRVLAATNKILTELVEQGLFRNDLYYRINIIKLSLPPLNSRKEDVPLLVDNFINRFNKLKGREVEGISEEALEVLMRHDFPGNIRELENIIEHAFVLCKEGLILNRHLPAYLNTKTDSKYVFNSKLTLPEMEAKIIKETLERNNWKKDSTARELGIDKSTLWRKIKKLKESGVIGT
ncbi:MAG: sigma-54 interaction domain-containing protein [Bacillota bacterium]